MSTKKVTFESVAMDEELPQITHEITQEMIWRNAAASLDYNPVHCDPEWVKTAQPFAIPLTVCHGMMTMSIMTSVITNWAYASGGWISEMEAKFVKPVPTGTIFTAGGKVTEKHVWGKNNSYVVVETWAQNQKGEKLALAKAHVVLPAS